MAGISDWYPAFSVSNGNIDYGWAYHFPDNRTIHLQVSGYIPLPLYLSTGGGNSSKGKSEQESPIKADEFHLCCPVYRRPSHLGLLSVGVYWRV